MPEQEDVEDKGGTMRLGAYPCKVAPASMAFKAYGEELIYERHRHRYEVNNAFRDRLAEAGLVISGVSPDGRLVEMIELPDHPWFVASQGHPEFKSRPTRPHPLFRDFVARGTGSSRVIRQVPGFGLNRLKVYIMLLLRKGRRIGRPFRVLGYIKMDR